MANFTLLAPVLMMLAHLSMLFIPELAYKICENHARLVNSGSYDGTWYPEYNGITCVKISWILRE